MVKVELLQPQDEKIWDEFVASQPDGRFSQTIAFKKVLQETYEYSAKLVVFKEDNEMLSVLPIFYWKNIFNQKKLISVPLADYGGILTKEMKESEVVIFINFIKKIIDELGVSFLKINANINLDKQGYLQKYFIKKENDQRAILSLSDPDILWEKIFDRSVRKNVNTAHSAGLVCEIKTSSDSIKNDFYPLYLKTMKRFGTPPHSLLYFQNKSKYFGEKMKLFLVKDRNITVAALLGFAIGKTVQITKTASDEKYWHKRPNDLAHWEFIKWAAENKFTYFDFGPVRYSNQVKYKVKWGAQLSDNYSYYLFSKPAEKIKEDEIKKTLIKGKLVEKILAKAWSYLPLLMTRFFGPCIRKNLGR